MEPFSAKKIILTSKLNLRQKLNLMCHLQQIRLISISWIQPENISVVPVRRDLTSALKFDLLIGYSLKRDFF